MEGREPSSRTPPFRPPNPALPYREDCWSEGETEVLIEAWGDRYIELNRGNLRQKQWQEVADAVNSRPCDARRPPRTDVQCKNRIDTLKKKYKVERAKIGGGSAESSQWKFYPKLEELIGSSVASHPPQKKPLPVPSQPPLALPLPSHRKGIPLPTASAVRPVEKRTMPVPKAMPVENSFYRRNYSAAAPEEEEEEDSEESLSRSSRSSFRERSAAPAFRERAGKRMRREEGEEYGIRELSRAIVRLAEIYERVEVEKQRQMMELEKQRMEFTKGLEFQRMQIFVDSQVQLAKVKRLRRFESGEKPVGSRV